ncbi:MAG: tetratricopeptide repeat protein [Desulfovibrio sp.]|jgi:tetratricopeptide (TPR) repeat protein|nr:tetratricopeptide repeat protein [Desulfovibrio sp.]
MPTLEPLRSQLNEVNDVLVQADGFALRMLWQGAVNPVVIQTLGDYGGLSIAEDENQALWFFFSSEALLACARLAVWARFNPLFLTLYVFPARFQSARNGEKTLIFDESILREDLPPPQEFLVKAHESMQDTAERVPGLSLKEKPESKNEGRWKLLDVDARLPYMSPLSWYVVLHPLGNPVDRSFLNGWREFFAQLESILQRSKLRFSLHGAFLMFPLEGLHQAKNWCRDFLNLVARLKNEAPEQYWPCVSVITERKGLSMNEDLPSKIDVPWDQLVPDYPHMPMHIALMLDKEFALHEVRFAPSRQSPDDWASLSLPDARNAGASILPQLAPVGLVFGPHPHCFYCGQRSHAPEDCPSKKMDPMQAGIWPKVARLDFSGMLAGVRGIDKGLGDIQEWKKKEAFITSAMREDNETGTILNAFYDITWPLQLRAVNFFWRARNKDLKKTAKTLANQDSSPLWALLDEYATKDKEILDAELQTLVIKSPKDYRVLSLRGFRTMELGDLEKAEKLWKEAEYASPHPIVQSWHALLQGRAMECQSRFSDAIPVYDQIYRTCPTLHDAEYRRIVCLIKSGFTERALPLLTALIEVNGHFFNKALLDPELERGYIQVVGCLYGLWTAMSAQAAEEEQGLKRMRDELGVWFLPDNAFAAKSAERIEKVLKITSVKNFVAFQTLATGRAQIEKDIQNHIMQEARLHKFRFKQFSDRLKVIHDESAWFPFPRTLAEFNKSYNQGVDNMNWALTANFHSPETFRKAQALLGKEEERLQKLESRLRFLRIVRDSTLFVLTMAETFLWLEIAGIIIIFVILPLFILYGDKIGMADVVSLIAHDRWQVQKALFIMVTALTFGAASLRTILRFESIREKILRRAMESGTRMAADRKASAGKKKGKG